MTEQADGQMSIFDHGSWSGKTSPELSAATKVKTSGLCSKRPQKSRIQAPLYLDLRKGSGLTPDALWETDGASLGEYSTHSFGECPKDGVESHLSQILEETPHPKYFLSAAAVIGILRRAEKRGKKLPTMLERALYIQSGLRGDTCGQEEIRNAGKILRKMWEEAGTKTFVEWARRTVVLVQSEKILLCGLCEQKHWRKENEFTCKITKGEPTEGETLCTTCPMRYLWESGIYRGTPQGRESDEQQFGKLSALVQELSRQTAPYSCFMLCLRSACERTPAMQQTLASLEKEYSTWLGHGIHEDDKRCSDTAVCYGISAFESNAMKSGNPHSGIYEAETARTLDSNGGSPACNQGGIAVVAIENHSGDSRVKLSKDNCVQCLSSRMGTGGGNTPLVMCIGNGQADQLKVSEKVGALNCMHDQQAVITRSVVRRLTPLECTRLQGFPDGWVDIGDWTDSKGKKHKDADSPKYKALGNSIAIPPWMYVLSRLNRFCAEHTMASLFDGISGFCLIWKRLGGEPIWSSEIEEFPIAVCKRHFGDEKNEEAGDIEKYL